MNLSLKIKDRQITAPALKHIAGIDQLRYIFAIWVFFAHGARPPFFAGHANTPLYNFIDHLYLWTIDGQAAVIGFFIISGLCIHYPNIRRNTFNIKSFYAARFVRLSVPLFACLTIAKLLNFQSPYGILAAVPVWTLYCEALYYLIYPFVLWIVKKGLLLHLIILTGFISITLIIIWSEERTMYFQDMCSGAFFDWKIALLALPCWLFGVLIGERISDASITNVKKSTSPLWMWRLGALCFSALVFPLYRIGLYFKLIFHPLIGLIFTSQFTLLLFGLYAFFWIEKEVLYNNFGNSIPSKLFERFGLASYTLYLIHVMILWLSEKITSGYFPGYLISWMILVLTLHILVFVFYVVIERPSHKFAKFCASYLSLKE